MLHEEQAAEQSPNKCKVCNLPAVLPVLTAAVLNVSLLSVPPNLTCWTHLCHWGCVKVTVTTDWQLGGSQRDGHH